MRLTRLLAGLFALVVLAATPLTVVASAEASQQSHHGVAQKAKSRTITLEFGANGATSFRLIGKVSPKGSKKAVTLLRSSTVQGTYRVVGNDKANAQGKFGFLGLKTEGYYRARVTGSSGYRTSFSKVVHVCKGTC